MYSFLFKFLYSLCLFSVWFWCLCLLSLSRLFIDNFYLFAFYCCQWHGIIDTKNIALLCLSSAVAMYCFAHSYRANLQCISNPITSAKVIYNSNHNYWLIVHILKSDFCEPPSFTRVVCVCAQLTVMMIRIIIVVFILKMIFVAFDLFAYRCASIKWQGEWNSKAIRLAEYQAYTIRWWYSFEAFSFTGVFPFVKCQQLLF